MESKKTILIFGISSFVGSSLAQELKDDYRVIGTFFSTPVDIPGVLSIRCDVHNKEMVQKTVFLFKPDVTVYAVGLSSIHSCQKHPKVADTLNTGGVFNVTAATERYKSKFVYFSSCFIFSGENTLFKENDTPMPSSVYGNTVASAEFYIQKSCLNYLIFRCSPIMGRSYNPMDSTWLETIDRLCHKGEKISCDTKVLHGFIDMWTVADVFKKAIAGNITNRLFQLSSKDIVNRYDFTKRYLERFRLNTSLLAKGDWHFPKAESALSMQNASEELYFDLDTENVEMGLSIQMPTVDDVIENIHRHLNDRGPSRKSAKSGEVNFI